MRRLIALMLALAAGPAFAQAQAPAAWQPYSPALVASANAGDPAAQYALGEAYRAGNGVVADRDQAIAWFRKAAPRDTRAADALGVLLFVKGDRKQAIPLLQAASQRGSAQADYILGTARFNGDYLPRDVGAAYAEMRLAAQKGLHEAERSLALMEQYITPDDRIRADALAAQPLGPEAGAAPLPAPPVPPAAVSPPVRTVKAPVVAASAAPSPATVPTLPPASASTAATPIATTDLPPSRPAAPAPVPAADAAASGWRVQLAAVNSPAEAESEWKRLSGKAPALLPLGHVALSGGSHVRLQATGIASRADAAALCQQLVDKKLGCFVVAPGAAPVSP